MAQTAEELTRRAGAEKDLSCAPVAAASGRLEPGRRLLASLPPADRVRIRRLAKSEVGRIVVEYGYAATPFGECLIATRENLICHLSFHEPAEREAARAELARYWPLLAARPDDERADALVREIFKPARSSPDPELIIPGSQFQHEVWQALQRIPSGSVTTYGTIARAIGAESAARAVGTAVGANRIAWLIPCHRVIPQSRQVGGFRWGPHRKQAMLDDEQSRQTELFPRR